MSAAEALAPERSVNEVRESLSVTEKGQPANTIGNCRTVFCHDPLLRGAIRLNLLTDRVDIVQDLGWRRNTSALTDTDVKYLLLYFEQTYGLTSEKKMTAALSIVANENCYHPIQDVLNGLVWDGTPRIRSCLHHFLGADESDYVEEMLKHFLLGAIRRVFRPGSKYEEMLCLVGGQGAGKSSFFRLLAIRDEWFSDDLKKLDDDRVYLKLQGHWIIEMSEMLATSSAKSIEEIRSFISRQKETYRTPYEAQPKDRLRQCVFGGSSNTLDFLPLVLRVTHQAEGRRPSAELPLPGAGGDACQHLFRNIPAVHIVQDILKGRNVHLLTGQAVHAVRDGDIAYIVFGEKDFDIAASFNIVPTKPG
jgi:predicted P-loop ATPase